MRLTRIVTLAAAVAVALPATGCLTTKSSCGADDCGGGAGGGHHAAKNDLPLQDRYNACVDPCWPERYSYQARQATLVPFANQVANGRAIDQTIFNGDFESGTAVLSPGGQKKLAILSRRRPVDGRIFVQTARDLRYDADAAGEYAEAKSKLDAARADAVQAYLAATTAGRNVQFEVAVSDPQDMTMPVVGPALAVRGYAFQHVSGITGIAGNGFAAGAGGANFIAPVTGGGFAGGFVPGANANVPGGNAGFAPGVGAPQGGNVGPNQAGPSGR